MKIEPEEFPPDERYLLGISGGRDSVALQQLLIEGGYRNLILCHLNHQLRGADSDADAAFVAELGPNVEIGGEDVRARAGRDSISIETAARQARHEFFARCAVKFGTNRVFLAHHADDQIETILMNLFRGAGSRGLSGMERVSAIQAGGQTLTLIRPLLEIPRAELPVPARFREDASNASCDFLRNRIRHEVIPAIVAATGRDLTAILRTAAILRDEDALLDELAREKLQQLLTGDGQLRAPELREIPTALQRRVIHAWLTGLAVADLSFENIEAVRALLEPDTKTAKINLSGDRHLRRREKRLFLE